MFYCVEPGWCRVRLRGVRVDRPWGKARLTWTLWKNGAKRGILHPKRAARQPRDHHHTTTSRRTMPSSPSSVTSKIDAAHGQVDAQSPLTLKEAGNDAVRTGDFKRATHMFTLGIDMILGSFEPNGAGDWYALDAKSKGLLHLLCSNRSLSHLNLHDFAAAAEDAEHCCLARPDFAKGHLRLLAALKAAEAPVEERRRACGRGLRACPQSKDLLDAKASLDDESGAAPQDAAGEDEAAALAAQLQATKLIADDPMDPRCAMAAGDYGSALALGAHGVSVDMVEAERYLRLGAEGGDAGSARALGKLLLQQEKAGEAAEYLRVAAMAGDDEAAATLVELKQESDRQREEALFRLRAMASAGDERAKAMLEELAEELGDK